MKRLRASGAQGLPEATRGASFGGRFLAPSRDRAPTARLEGRLEGLVTRVPHTARRLVTDESARDFEDNGLPFYRFSL